MTGEVFADRVQEYTSTTGTSDLVLGGAASQMQRFETAIGASNPCFYCLKDGNGTDWEVGQGTIAVSGTVLSRATILASSNLNAKINLSSNTHTVFSDAPAEFIAQIATIPKAGEGLILNSGTFNAHSQQTLSASGTITVQPTSGVTSVLLNGPPGGTVEIDIGPALFADQPIRLICQQDSGTAAVWHFGPGFHFGTILPSITITASPAAYDIIQTISNRGTVFDVMAVQQGFTV